jgi:hypothetical protein
MSIIIFGQESGSLGQNIIFKCLQERMMVAEHERCH